MSNQNKMYKFFLFFIVIHILLNSCIQKPANKFEEMYEIVEHILNHYYSDVDLVVLKLKTNQIDYKNYLSDTLSAIPPLPDPPPLRPLPPPFPINESYKKDQFKIYYQLKYIDSIDVEYMYNQIDIKETYILDSAKIAGKVILQTDKKFLIKKYGSNDINKVLFEKLNAHKYIEFSVPLISKDSKKILIKVDTYCGDLCGSSILYFLEKKDDKWVVNFGDCIWMSH